jgi:hypothetical protein
MNKLGYILLATCIHFAMQAQEITKHPLDGVWKWKSTKEDGSTEQGFRWYWTDEAIGIHRIANVSLDPETLEPVHAWSVFQTPTADGIGDRLWVDTDGRQGRSTERFSKRGSSTTFSGASASGNVSGIIELEWNKAGDKFEEHVDHFTGFELPYEKRSPTIEAHKIDYKPRERGEIVWPQNMRALLDPRLQDLLGTWESTDKDGKVGLRIKFSPWLLGHTLLERFVFLDAEDKPSRGGYNLTRKDPLNDQLIMYSIGRNGFSQVGGWDFLGGSTTGQRQGGGRLVRTFLSEDEIQARWQSKQDGEFIDDGNSYILKRQQTGDAESTAGSKNRSYHQRSLDAKKFTGFIKTDFKIVSESDEAAYLAAEQEWKGLHEQIMQKGGLLHWHVARITNAKPGEPNYATVQVYASMEDMQDGAVWDTLDYAAVGGRESLGKRTWPHVKHAGSDVYQAMDQFWSPDAGDMEIDLINMGYMSVKSGMHQAYLNAERTSAKPFWNVVSSLDPSFGGWAMHRLVESSRAGVNHDYITLHFKTKKHLPDQKTWQSNTQLAMGMLNKPQVDWNRLREMQGGPQYEIVLKANPEFHPVKSEWKKLVGNWKHTHENGNYRIKRITPHTEQLEMYKADGTLIGKGIFPMKIEVKGGLNHFYSFKPNWTYHSIYKVADGKWYEQMRGIWRDANGKPDTFLVYEKL